MRPLFNKSLKLKSIENNYLNLFLSFYLDTRSTGHNTFYMQSNCYFYLVGVLGYPSYHTFSATKVEVIYFFFVTKTTNQMQKAIIVFELFFCLKALWTVERILTKLQLIFSFL